MLRLFSCALLVTGCAGVTPPIKPRCAPPLGWEAAAERAEGRILTFGELHGTDQGPDLVAEYVCAAAADRGGRTVMAVEIGEEWRDELEIALGSASPSEALVAAMGDFWSGLDGRSSKAVLRFLIRMAELRRAGLDIDVVPFANFSAEAIEALRERGDPALIERDYARRIIAISEGAQRTIVMVGNFHAAKAQGQHPFVTYAPMASYFDDSAVSLDISHDGGTSWNMLSENDAGARQTKASILQPTERRHPHIALDEELLPYFDGYFYVGPLTASPPALPATQP